VGEVVNGPFIDPVTAEIEMALLGCLIRDNRTIVDVGDILLAEHFQEPCLGDLYAVCQDLVAAGKRPDAPTLGKHIAEDSRFDALGRNPVALIVDVGGQPSQARWYAQVIVDQFKRRSFALDLEMAQNELRSGSLVDRPADEVISDLMSKAVMLEDALDDDVQKPFTRVIDEAYQRTEAAIERRDGGNLAGLTTGLPALDRVIGGWQPGKLYVLAGRTGMGKTALGTCSAYALAKAGHRVWFRSLEMSDVDVAQRIIALASDVSVDDQAKGKIGAFQRTDLAEARAGLEALPIDIDQAASETIDQFAIRAMRQHAKRPFEIIFFDYLQLLRTTDRERRFEMLGRATRRLKELSKLLHVPIVAMAQIARRVEDRPDKRPMLSDLRESGDIEQDADVVLMVYRQSYYNSEFSFRDQGKEPDVDYMEARETAQRKWEDEKDVAEVIIAKNRQGPTSRVFVSYHQELMKFYEKEE
jgi:replicative DNA helicase